MLEEPLEDIAHIALHFKEYPDNVDKLTVEITKTGWLATTVQ